MQGKIENVNLHIEDKEKKHNNMQGYCQRKIKNFMYTSSIFSIIYGGHALLNHEFPDALLGVSCFLGLYSVGKLIGTKWPSYKPYTLNSTAEPIIIGSQIYELKKEKKCYTLSQIVDKVQ